MRRPTASPGSRRSSFNCSRTTLLSVRPLSPTFSVSRTGGCCSPPLDAPAIRFPSGAAWTSGTVSAPAWRRTAPSISPSNWRGSGGCGTPRWWTSLSFTGRWPAASPPLPGIKSSFWTRAARSCSTRPVRRYVWSWRRTVSPGSLAWAFCSSARGRARREPASMRRRATPPAWR